MLLCRDMPMAAVAQKVLGATPRLFLDFKQLRASFLNPDKGQAEKPWRDCSSLKHSN